MSTTCERCGNPLTGKQGRWCSPKCSRLGLKSVYRKRNIEKIKKQNREYRRARNGGNRPPKNAAKLRDNRCLRCQATEDLQLAHVKPLWAGGVHKYVITLCRSCHHLFDNLLREFWQEAIDIVQP